MTGQHVDRLYDALHALEARRRGRSVYPVHKSLRADRLGSDDIYDWIIAQLGGNAIPRRVLDAGCGVGYGSIRLAQRLGCHVTGISLSRREVDNARAVASDLRLGRHVEFERATFDDLPVAAYDLIVAVESLKHSSDLARTLSSMLAALTPRGVLVIVDDCYAGAGRVAAERQLVADWELARLYTAHDFLLPLGDAVRTIVDLSGSVRRSGRLSITLRLLGVQLARWFVSESPDLALRAFRGGLRLEQLYADGAMSYKAIFAQAPEA